MCLKQNVCLCQVEACLGHKSVTIWTLRAGSKNEGVPFLFLLHLLWEDSSSAPCHGLHPAAPPHPPLPHLHLCWHPLLLLAHRPDSSTDQGAGCALHWESAEIFARYPRQMHPFLAHALAYRGEKIPQNCAQDINTLVRNWKHLDICE